MPSELQPHRCPRCNALVVDRRSPNCTTCREPLPADWLMTKQQVEKVMKLDAAARAQHLAEMSKLDPRLNPNTPAIVKLLNADASSTGLL